MQINDLLEICYGKDFKHLNKGKYPVLGTGGVIDYVDGFLYSGESILIGRKGTIDKPRYINESFWTVDTLFYTKIYKGMPKFIFYQLNNINWLKYNEASGVPSLSANNVKKIRINLPSEKEQMKIANFLTKIDEKIELLEKKCDFLKEYKTGFIQKLRKGEIKFKKDNKNYPKWEEIPLKDILYEHKLKSTGNEEVYSVSVHKGVVNQIEHLGRSFATEDLSKYKLVKPGDIIYTKSPTAGFELGIIKQNKNDKNVLVSPLYSVFTPKNAYLGNYIDAYFESSINTRNYLHPIVQKGAKNTMNISNKVFLSRSLLLPVDFEEQKKISNYINLINQKYEDSYNLCENIKLIKKGLLQKMFV